MSPFTKTAADNSGSCDELKNIIKLGTFLHITTPRGQGWSISLKSPYLHKYIIMFYSITLIEQSLL